VWGVVSWNVERERAFSRAQDNAELLREYALRVFESQQSLLIEAEHLLNDIDVVTADQADIHQALQPLLGHLRFTLGVGVIGPQGQILGSTTYPVSGSAEDRTYFLTLRDGNTNLYVERVTLQGDQEALLVARSRDTLDFEGVLVAAVDVETVSDFFGRVASGGDASVSLVGDDGSLLLRFPELPLFKIPSDAPLMSAIAERHVGVLEARATFDNGTRIFGFARLGQFPVTVVFGEASSSVLRDWLDRFVIVLALLSVTAMLGFAATTQAFRRLKAEQQQRALALDRQLLARAQQAATDREDLLREAHHRTKNNLQMMLSMIHNKANSLGDPECLKDIENRLFALSHLHDQLYAASDSGSTIDLGHFLKTICQNPSIVPPERNIDLVCDVEPLPVTITQAVPIALIAVETITNTLKHAFAAGSSGRIGITLRREGGTAVLSIKDNGRGLPPVDERERTSGLRLIEALTRQIDGRLDIKVEGGTEFILEVPLAEGSSNAQASGALAAES
jgi:two-component sensor histidine kinase